MGTEVSYPIGTILTRRTPLGDPYDEVRVIGAGKQLVVTSNKEFANNIQLDGAVVRRDYTTEIPDSVLLSQPSYLDPGPTPEQVFSGTTTQGDGLTRVERAARKSEDPRTELESVRTDTGIPVVVSEIVNPPATVTEPAPTVSEPVVTTPEPTGAEIVTEATTEPPAETPAEPVKRGRGRPRKNA